MPLWLIPMIYVGVSVVCGLSLPRIEQAYLASYSLGLSADPQCLFWGNNARWRRHSLAQKSRHPLTLLILYEAPEA